MGWAGFEVLGGGLLVLELDDFGDGFLELLDFLVKVLDCLLETVPICLVLIILLDQLNILHNVFSKILHISLQLIILAIYF